MSTFIGLLRGINVGGKNKIKMAVLAEILAAVGLKNLTTYIQSGNLVFKSTKKPPALERLIKKSISDQLGLEVSVFVRDVSLFENVFADNPYRTPEITSLCVSFFSDKPDKALIDAIQSGDYGPDEHTIKNDVAYLYFPNGVRNTKLTNGFFEKKLQTTATTRNWKTVTKLIELAGGNR